MRTGAGLAAHAVRLAKGLVGARRLCRSARLSLVARRAVHQRVRRRVGRMAPRQTRPPAGAVGGNAHEASEDVAPSSRSHLYILSSPFVPFKVRERDPRLLLGRQPEATRRRREACRADVGLRAGRRRLSLAPAAREAAGPDRRGRHRELADPRRRPLCLSLSVYS